MYGPSFPVGCSLGNINVSMDNYGVFLDGLFRPTTPIKHVWLDVVHLLSQVVRKIPTN